MHTSCLDSALAKTTDPFPEPEVPTHGGAGAQTPTLWHQGLFISAAVSSRGGMSFRLISFCFQLKRAELIRSDAWPLRTVAHTGKTNAQDKNDKSTSNNNNTTVTF